MILRSFGEPRGAAAESTEYPGMVIACRGCIVTNEHSSSSYGAPVILSADGTITDYSDWESIIMPQSDFDGRVFEPLWSAYERDDGSETDYADAVSFMRRLEPFGVRIEAVLDQSLAFSREHHATA